MHIALVLILSGCAYDSESQDSSVTHDTGVPLSTQDLCDRYNAALYECETAAGAEYTPFDCSTAEPSEENNATFRCGIAAYEGKDCSTAEGVGAAYDAVQACAQ